MEETFVWTSERFPLLFIPHNYTSASNIPWYGNWPLVNIICHAAAFGKLQFEQIRLLKISFHCMALLGQTHNWVQTAVKGARCICKVWGQWRRFSVFLSIPLLEMTTS